MSKPRLVIPMTLQFAVRYVLRTGLLARIREFAHPVIALGWADADLQEELQSAGAEVHVMADAKWGADYQKSRTYLNVWHVSRMNSPSAGVWERRADLDRSLPYYVRRRLRKKILETCFAMPKGLEWLRRRERKLFWEDTNAKAVDEQAQRLRADAVFSLTPFLPSEEMLLRALERRKTPMCNSMLSFDNITTRGWIPVHFDQYMVWNKYNKSELLRGYPDVAASDVSIVGSPQFDFYYDPAFCWDEADWRERMGLPAQGRVILFGGGYFTCAPHEPEFLLQLDQAIDRNEVPRDCVVLFRSHPVDPIERWKPYLAKTKHTVMHEPWPGGKIQGKTNVRRADIEKLTSCLKHSQVHVNIASTMAVDGAILDRPQIGPAYDDTPGHKFNRTSKELYMQEHYLPIARSGGLEIVESRAAFIQAVNSALEAPERLNAGRKQLVKEICTFDDGKSTERVANKLRSFVEQNVSVRDEAIETVA